jgi:alpha-L-fucosidase
VVPEFALKFENGPMRKFHDATFGPNIAYDDLAPLLDAATIVWNPPGRADLSEKLGARYVVQTTKLHHCFTLCLRARSSA